MLKIMKRSTYKHLEDLARLGRERLDGHGDPVPVVFYNKAVFKESVTIGSSVFHRDARFEKIVTINTLWGEGPAKIAGNLNIGARSHFPFR